MFRRNRRHVRGANSFVQAHKKQEKYQKRKIRTNQIVIQETNTQPPAIQNRPKDRSRRSNCENWLSSRRRPMLPPPSRKCRKSKNYKSTMAKNSVISWWTIWRVRDSVSSMSYCIRGLAVMPRISLRKIHRLFRHTTMAIGSRLPTGPSIPWTGLSNLSKDCEFYRSKAH